MTASVSQLYGQRPISEAQLRRLHAIVHGTREQPPRLGGTKRDRVNQLNEMLEAFGYDWDAVDEMCDPLGWITNADYDQLCAQLEVIRGGAL